MPSASASRARSTALVCTVCLAGVRADDAGIGTLRLVDQSAFPRAACLDGSPPAFYFRPATTDAGRSKFLLYHEGGDFCGYGDTWEEWIEDCRQRAHTPLGSSRHLAANSTSDLYSSGVDAFARDPEALTFEWNWIYMMYCDGHYYAGANLSTTIAPVPNRSTTEELFFRGRFNVEAVIGSVGLSTSAPAPVPVTDVLVHGCSSGAVAVFSNADAVRAMLPTAARVAGAANSGYYLSTHPEYTDYWTRPPYLMANLTASLSPACVQSAASPWNCIVADVAAPHIVSLPIFAWQSRYDSNQLSCVLIDPANVTAVNAYGDVLENSMRQWVREAEAPGFAGVPRGAFVDGCYRHCGCSSGITAGSWTPRTALASWWEGLWDASPATANTSRIWSQNGEYYCKSCCTHPLPEIC